MGNKRLAGKVALVSGGARGLGASHVRSIIKEGGKAVIGDLLDSEGEALAAELGEAALFVHLDVTNDADWQKAVALAQKHFGKLNVLVNNAGILNAAPTEDYSNDAWDKIIAVNLTGTFKGIRAALPALKAAAPNSIINTSSTAGLKGFAGTIGYNATKFGVRGLTKSLAVELADSGVRVNSIHPGNTATDMIDGLYKTFRHVPMRRAGKPIEISNLVVFLASDESTFSTGAEFIADGGETAGLPHAAMDDD